MNIAFPNLGIIPGGYAVVGAAAFSAGVTRTVASGIIVFELTGQMTHLLPVLITVLIAASVGNFFTLSVYDTLLREKGLPFIPAIKNNKLMKKTVGFIMNTDLHLVTTEMNYHDLQDLLKRSEEPVYPLVDNKRDRIFLCQIQRFALERHLFKHELDYRRLLAEYENSDSSSSSDDGNVMGTKLMRIEDPSDTARRLQRHRQERRERRRRRRQRREERQRQELQQHVQKQLQLYLVQQPQTQQQPMVPVNPFLQPDQPPPSPTPQIQPQPVVIVDPSVQELARSFQEPPSSEKILEQSQKLADKILESTKKRDKHKKKHKKIKKLQTHDEFFSQSCGFENLAKYLASHGVAGNEETVQPALDPTRATEGEGENAVDLCPYTVMETSPLNKVHFMFAVMGLSHVWVVREGRLMGLVAKEHLMNMEKE